MAEQLKVKCKTCGVEFASPIQMDKASFPTASLSGNSFPCPQGHVAAYDKQDMYFA